MKSYDEYVGILLQIYKLEKAMKEQEDDLLFELNAVQNKLTTLQNHKKMINREIRDYYETE